VKTLKQDRMTRFIRGTGKTQSGWTDPERSGEPLPQAVRRKSAANELTEFTKSFTA
jgi:hypothetical protein